MDMSTKQPATDVVCRRDVRFVGGGGSAHFGSSHTCTSELFRTLLEKKKKTPSLFNESHSVYFRLKYVFIIKRLDSADMLLRFLRHLNQTKLL